MITPERLITMARKWHKMAAKNRQRITFPRRNVATKGHFVVYTADRKRFTVPLEYLNKDVFRELFRMSEEEFGLATNGPITLPCESSFLTYAITLVRGQAPEDVEAALINSITTCHSSGSSSVVQKDYQQIPLYGF